MSAFAGSFNITTAAATNTVAVTGVGFTPVAIIFSWSSRTESTDASGGADAAFGMGFCAGTTDRRSMCNFVEDAQTTTDTGMRQSTDACIMQIGTAAGDQIGAADLDSFDADGFTMVIDDDFTIDMRISFLALGGDHNNAATGDFVMSATGELAETGVGFAPGCVLFMGSRFTTVTTQDNTQVVWAFGAATAAASEFTIGLRSRHAQATSESARYGFGAECLSIHETTADDPFVRAELTSLDADGFTVEVLEVGATRIGYYLALGGGQYHVGDILTATDTTNFSTTGVGFQPTGVLFASHCVAEDTQDTGVAELKWSIGAATGAAERTAQAVSDQDGLTTTETFTAIEHDEVYIRPDLADGVEGLMDLVSLDADGFTNVMDDADPDAAFVGYVAFGDAVGVSQLPEMDRAARKFLHSPLLRM